MIDSLGTQLIRMQEGFSSGVWKLNENALEMSMSIRGDYCNAEESEGTHSGNPPAISQRLLHNLWIKHSELLSIFSDDISVQSVPLQSPNPERVRGEWHEKTSHQLLVIEGNSFRQIFKTSTTSMKHKKKRIRHLSKRHVNLSVECKNRSKSLENWREKKRSDEERELWQERGLEGE